MKLLFSVAAVLGREGISYALIGAGALARHGVARSTVAWDLLVVEPACLERERWSALARDGIDVSPRRGDASDPLAGVVRFEGPGEGPVDLVIGKLGWQRDILLRAEPMGIAGKTLPVVQAPDLILLKLYAGGPQDAWDITQLLAGGVSREDVERELDKLPPKSRALWRRLTQPEEPEPDGR